MLGGPHRGAATAQLAARSLTEEKHGLDGAQQNSSLRAEQESPAPRQLTFSSTALMSLPHLSH